MIFDDVANLEQRDPHDNSEGLGLRRAGYNTTVVVRQDDDGAPIQVGLEHALA